MSCNCNKKGHSQGSRESYEYTQNQPKVSPNGRPYTLQPYNNFSQATIEKYDKAYYREPRTPTEQQQKQNMWNGVG